MTQPLINTETGEIDHLAIIERAPLRAAREYGSPNFPPLYLRQAFQWLNERAEMERTVWRHRHGLPYDGEPMVIVNMPDWGASGDSFARAHR